MLETINTMFREQSADSTTDIEIGLEDGVSTPPPSPTALQLDDWAMRRGRDVLADSEVVRKAFELGEKDPLANLRPEKLRGEARDRFNALARQTADFHAAAFEPEPTLAPACENERLHRYMQNLLDTPEFKALHGETQLDETASELAAAAFAKEFMAICKTEEPADDFKKDMQALSAASKALKSAGADVTDLRDAQSALGIGGDGGGQNRLPASDLAKLFKRVRGSEQLKRICELAGRYRRYAQQRQRKKVLHGQDDIVGVVLDGDIGRLLPHELAALDDADLELDVMRRIIERQAMCREYRGVESKARGPIVVVVDESGSMTGLPIATAKAIALAMAWVAKNQRRWYALVGFSGGTNGTYCVSPPNGIPRFIDQEEENAQWKASPDALMEWLEHFYSGGTNCDVPLVELPKLWASLGCPRGKTDMIVITDAQVNVPPAVAKAFLAWKAAENVKLVSIILNHEPGDLAGVSDRVHRVRSLSLDEEAVGDVLGI